MWCLDPNLHIVEFGSLTSAQRDELEGDEQDPFDGRGSTLRYRSKDRHIGISDEHGRLVASAGLVLADVEIRHERFPVVGFGGVIVTAAHRGQGLAREVMEAAIAKASRMGPGFALLFCHEDRAGLYRKLGFAEIADDVVVQQPAGDTRMPQQTMWRPLRPDATWPPGEVVVRSLPF